MKIIHGAAFNQGKFPTIGVVNLATVPLGDFSLTALVAALQKSLDQHFVPIWGYPAKLVIYPNIQSIPRNQWQFIFMDDADAAGALGYHDLTKDGQPISKIFVKTTINGGEDVAVTASHELFEMLIDPGAQLWAQKDSKTLVAYEMSDPVEEQYFLIDGIKISNFVYPSYFEPWHRKGSTQFDHLKQLTRPFSLAKGGYIIKMVSGKVSEQFGSRAKARRFAKESRRGHRSEHRKPAGKVIKPTRWE